MTALYALIPATVWLAVYLGALLTARHHGLHNPQHFGADGGGVGNGRVNLHFDREHY